MSVKRKLKELSNFNTMDKIMIRVDEDTLIPIGEFLERKGFRNITARIQKDLKTLYKLNDREPPLFNFPDFPSNKPLIIDCSTATTDNCIAHYIYGEHIVEFQQSVHDDFQKNSEYSLLSTLAHELKHAEQDVPAIWNYKNAFQYHQLSFLQEAQAYTFGRYVMNLAGDPDPAYRAVVKKHTNSLGIVDEKAVEMEILQQELIRLFDNETYRNRYDRYLLVQDDDTGITEIPKEFDFPDAAVLYKIIQNTPREPLEPDKLKYDRTPSFNYLRKYPNLLQKPELFKHYDRACSEVLFGFVRHGIDKKRANADLKLFENLLKAKDSDETLIQNHLNKKGHFVCSDETLIHFLSQGKDMSQEPFIRAPGDVMVSPKELFVLFENGDISREEWIQTLEYHNAGRRLKDLAVSTTASDTKLSTPVADTFTYQFDKQGSIEVETGFKNDRITSYTQYYDGKKVKAYYFLSDKDKEKLDEWITSEAWMEYGPNDKPCYVRIVFNKEKNTSRVLFYTDENLTKFLYGRSTNSDGKSTHCDEKGSAIATKSNLFQRVRNRLLSSKVNT